MGHDKLRKFAENETFSCLLQPSSQELLRDGYFALRDHEVKGRWGERFAVHDAPLVLELGCGKGEYTVDLARRDPSRNYVGVDIKGARLWKGAKQATAEGLGNVGFLRTRIEFITAFFAPEEVSEIWLTFSDPQVRSENSRLTSPIFLERYRRFLAPGGLVHLKTDSQFLYQYTLAVCRRNGLEVVASSEDLYSEPERFEGCLTQVQTFYESMFREQGYPIRYLCFRLDGGGAGVAGGSLAGSNLVGDEAGNSLADGGLAEGAAGASGGGLADSAAGASGGGLADGAAGNSLADGDLANGAAGAGGGGLAGEVSRAAARPLSSPEDFDPDYWRSIEGDRTLFGRDTAETRRQKLSRSR